MKEPLYQSGLNQVKAYRVIQATVTEVLDSFGLDSASDWFALCHLYHKGASRSVDIAELLGVQPPLVVIVTDALERKGLIKKIQHAKDKRVKTLEITAKGRKLVPVVEKALKKELDKLFSGVRGSQLNAYDQVLRSVIANSGR